VGEHRYHNVLRHHEFMLAYSYFIHSATLALYHSDKEIPTAAFTASAPLDTTFIGPVDDISDWNFEIAELLTSQIKSVEVDGIFRRRLRAMG
jgi:hypothetical protein